MPTLLLRLVGPMQSWGVQSNFIWRETGYEPSKSGVIGLLCAAWGRKRDERIDDLAALTMGVRVDKAGTMLRDFHTAGKDGYVRASGGPPERKNVIISHRDYLADAAFLVGLESDDEKLLHTLHNKLRNPYWPLCLGRKAYVPGLPVWLKDGMIHGPLLEALGEYPWLGSGNKKPETLYIFYDHPEGEIVRPDQPISFKPRQFAPRRIKRQKIELIDAKLPQEGA